MYKILLVFFLEVWITGCTTIKSHTTIEQYTTDKNKRNAIEQLAEEYCRKKRASANIGNSVRLPDYIFTTDGCSRSPDGAWVSCCIVPDISYWCGGAQKDRKEADQIFSRCLKEKAGGVIGSHYYVGVRLGGTVGLPTPWLA